MPDQVEVQRSGIRLPWSVAAVIGVIVVAFYLSEELWPMREDISELQQKVTHLERQTEILRESIVWLVKRHMPGGGGRSPEE